MDSRSARVARGGVAAGFATFVAAFSHALAGGVAPSAFGMLVCLVIAATVCILLAGRTLSIVRLAASVAISQALFHSLFVSLGTPVIAPHGMGSMIPDAAALHPHAGATMWLAHALAALVTVAALRFGERALWGLGSTTRLLLARLLPVLVVLFAVPRRVRVLERRFMPRDLAPLLSTMRHRGPPLECA